MVGERRCEGIAKLFVQLFLTFSKFSVTSGKSLFWSPITSPNNPYLSPSSISAIIPKSINASFPSGVLKRLPSGWLSEQGGLNLTIGYKIDVPRCGSA